MPALFRILSTILLLVLILVFPAHAQNQPQNQWMVLMSPDNSFNFDIYKDGEAVATIGATGWGPNWGWRGFGVKQRATGDELNVSAPFESNKDAGEIINVALNAKKTAPNAVTLRYTLGAEKNVPLTFFVATINTAKDAQDGQVLLHQTDGNQTTWPLSLSGIRSVGATDKITFQSKKAGDFALNLNPPLSIANDNGMRVVLAEKEFGAGTKTINLTFTFPGNAELFAKDSDLARFTKTLPTADWFPFKPGNDLGPSAIGFEGWLDKPAGKHGGVRQNGDKFSFEDGTSAKFWGTNLSYGTSAPEKAQADSTAARFAKMGVNAVRMHKFTGSGWEGIGDENDATKMEAKGLDRLDYFSSQLAKSGVYYGWSHTYHFVVKPGNRDRLLAPDEIEKNLKGDTYAFINIAEDVQDLLIERVVNLLKHTNPYTGKTYASDPALCFIEMQNEDDIFFWTNEQALNSCPTYKKRFTEQFSDWLKAKYGTTNALKTTWGEALKEGETLEAKNISLQGNVWFFTDDHLPQTKGGERQRLLDNSAFFHYSQNKFYARFAKAIRAAGYQGPLIGSPWQAPSMLPHYYNLRSDALAGYVDRHNYFGEKLGDTMLKNPGSGYFSTGLQQVAGLPFGLSEWIHVYPSLYSAEGPPLLAAYGMGLQGWDASYEFQSNSNAPWSEVVGNFPWGVWNADVPTQIGQYPLLARMIARGDVQQGEAISVRRVSDAELAEGKFNFSDKVQQQGDVKTFGGSVPAEALAAVRCLVEFTDKTQPSTFPDMAAFKQGDVITSSTGQLKWDAAQGFFTINTAGTKGVVGFAQNKDISLGNVSIKTFSPYASILLTSSEKGADLTKCKRALLSVMARNSNSDFSYFTLDNRVLNNGKGPILLEPVQATVSIFNRPLAAVNILDHDGKPTGRTVPVLNGTFQVDGTRDKALYYEIVFG